MITLEEFEDQLVDGISKIESQYLHSMMRPSTLDQMRIQVDILINNLGDQLYLNHGEVREKVLVKVSSDTYDGVVKIELLDPREPFYEVRYDGTLGPRVTGYRNYHTSKKLYNSLIGLP